MLRFADAVPVKTLPVVACLGRTREKKRGKGRLVGLEGTLARSVFHRRRWRLMFLSRTAPHVSTASTAYLASLRGQGPVLLGTRAVKGGANSVTKVPGEFT